jgi:hypothetical protein
VSEESAQPLAPSVGDYVLATKYQDGDPGDPWALGFYAGINDRGRHLVKDGTGQLIRAGGYKRVGRVSEAIGRWLLTNADLLERAPSKINLWGMYDWEFVNESIGAAK